MTKVLCKLNGALVLMEVSVKEVGEGRCPVCKETQFELSGDWIECSTCRGFSVLEAHYRRAMADVSPNPADVGEKLLRLFQDLSRWSQETFGTDQQRGPVGALWHLQEEAAEAIGALGDDRNVEISDCLMLVLDAARRSGMSVTELLDVAARKLEVNFNRSWPKPTSSDQPVRHIK